MTHKKHTCDLDLGSDSMLPKKKTVVGRAFRWLRKLGQLTKYHPETFEYFRSYSAVVAERQRQLLEEGGQVIHPLSLFSLFWGTFMVAVNIFHIGISSFRLFYIVEPIQSIRLHTADRLLLLLHAICIVDIGLKFNTGYVDTKHSNIVMGRKWIACLFFQHLEIADEVTLSKDKQPARTDDSATQGLIKLPSSYFKQACSIFDGIVTEHRYLRCWFILDAVSCVPIAFALLYIKGTPRSILIAHLLPLIRITRIYSISKDLKTFMRIFTESYIVHGLVRIAVLFVLTAHWCSCLMYSPTIGWYYWTGHMPTQYNFYLRIHGPSNLLHHTIQTRYNKAIIVTVSAFFGTGFTMFRSSQPDEILIHSFIIVYAAMFMVFTLVFLIKSYLTIFTSSMRYHGLMNQVEEYMKYRQFPVALKKRVLAFYEYRYQERYFKEEAELDCLSEELRDEIKLHTCRTLAHKVKLFENVPASVVGTVLGCLHPEVYLSNDLVVRAGDIGDCMYFIATGTVAVYSLKGVEVCHLEDGSHFGEVALLMKDSKRVATVVAVEITQLYRLDAIDFNRYVLSHETLFGRIEAMASRRMHETVLLDDAFRHERVKVEQHHSSDLIDN